MKMVTLDDTDEHEHQRWGKLQKEGWFVTFHLWQCFFYEIHSLCWL